MQIATLRRPRTRRERLRRRADDVVGYICWRATRWYGGQLKAALRSKPVRRARRRLPV
jgi:hypothetical protein